MIVALSFVLHVCRCRVDVVGAQYKVRFVSFYTSSVVLLRIVSVVLALAFHVFTFCVLSFTREHNGRDDQRLACADRFDRFFCAFSSLTRKVLCVLFVSLASTSSRSERSSIFSVYRLMCKRFFRTPYRALF